MDTAKEALNEILHALGGRDFLVLDTETTGLNDPELVSIGVIDSKGKIVIDEIVRPGKPIEPGASRVTGITNEVVADKPEFPAIYERLNEELNGKLVVIYNASYDLKVLRNTCRRYNLPMPQFDPWCTMEWFAKLYGRSDNYRQSFTWQKLSTAASYFGVKRFDAHAALGDCLTTWHIIGAALDQARKMRQYMDPLL